MFVDYFTFIYFLSKDQYKPMLLCKEEKSNIIKQFVQTGSADTGSTEVQIALLTHRIKHLTQHFKIHKKDNHSRRGLIMLVSKRKKLLKYLNRISLERYKSLIQTLKLRK